MKLVDPFKEPEYNSEYPRRFRQTVEFITYPHGNVLVIGEQAPFEVLLEEHFDKLFEYTAFDLNYKWPSPKKNDTILCFQILEHILNPLMLLSQCYRALKKDGILYISYPTHGTKWFWSSGHWHEMDKSRFQYLVKLAGFQIKDESHHIMWRRIKGFRSILRNTPIGWCIHHYYKLVKA